MASPQKEYGYTIIANEILEAMARTKLSPTQYRLLFTIWRYTYGFQRKEANLSLTFLASATGCDKRSIQREMKELDRRNIIFQRFQVNSSRLIGFNKDYEQWLDSAPIGQTANGETTNGEIANVHTTNNGIGRTANPPIGRTANPPIGRTANQERNVLKKTIKKDNDNDDDNDRAHAEKITTIKMEQEPKSENLFIAFENEFGRPLSPIEIDQIKQWEADHSAELVLESLRRSVLMGKCTLKYINSIMNEWKKNNVVTLKDVIAFDAEFQKKKVKSLEKARDAPKSGQARAPAENAVDKKKKDFIRSLYI